MNNLISWLREPWKLRWVLAMMRRLTFSFISTWPNIMHTHTLNKQKMLREIVQIISCVRVHNSLDLLRQWNIILSQCIVCVCVCSAHGFAQTVSITCAHIVFSCACVLRTPPNKSSFVEIMYRFGMNLSLLLCFAARFQHGFEKRWNGSDKIRNAAAAYIQMSSHLFTCFRLWPLLNLDTWASSTLTHKSKLKR